MCDTDAAKASTCRELGISHFVDDRVDVLELSDSVARRYLFVCESDDAASTSLPSNMLRVAS